MLLLAKRMPSALMQQAMAVFPWSGATTKMLLHCLHVVSALKLNSHTYQQEGPSTAKNAAISFVEIATTSGSGLTHLAARVRNAL